MFSWGARAGAAPEPVDKLLAGAWAASDPLRMEGEETTLRGTAQSVRGHLGFGGVKPGGSPGGTFPPGAPGTPGGCPIAPSPPMSAAMSMIW